MWDTAAVVTSNFISAVWHLFAFCQPSLALIDICESRKNTVFHSHRTMPFLFPMESLLPNIIHKCTQNNIHSWIKWLNIITMIVLLKLIYKSNMIPIKNIYTYLMEWDELILISCKNKMAIKTMGWGLAWSDIKTYYKVSIKQWDASTWIDK